MVYQLAASFAGRVLEEAGADRAAQVERVFLAALGRRPRPEELAVGVECLRQLTRECLDENASEAQAPESGRVALTTFCHAFMNLGEFLYVD